MSIVGRRYSGVPKEMEDDLGIPGKLYFDKPQVMEISVKRENNKVITQDLMAVEGSCRLKSTRELRDFVHRDVITYRVSQRPTVEEIHDYMKWAGIQGFGNGAVVARRWSAPWRWETPYQWGVILGCKLYPQGPNDADPWAPFVIRWFDITGVQEPAWAEDLFLIHQQLSKDLLISIVEEQGDGWVT
jgi:hypothetical protein